MNKKSIILSLVLAGSFLTPSQTKPTELLVIEFVRSIVLAHFYEVAAITSITGAGVTTALTIGYLIKKRIQKYKKARNFLKKQSEIKTYKVAITIKERPRNSKEFNSTTICYTFSNDDYKLLIQEVKQRLKVFEQTEMPKFKYNSKLRFLIETEVLLENGKAYTLFPTKIRMKPPLNRKFTDKEIAKITKKIQKKFYIPILNIGYKIKAFLGFLGGLAVTSTIGLAIITYAHIAVF